MITYTDHPQSELIYGRSWEEGMTCLGDKIFRLFFLCEQGNWEPVTRKWNDEKKDFDNTAVDFKGDVKVFYDVFWVRHTTTGKLYRCNQRSRVWAYDRKFDLGRVVPTTKSTTDKLHSAFTSIRKHVNRGKNLHGNSRSEKMVAQYDALKETVHGTDTWTAHCEKFDLDIDHDGASLFI